MPIDVVLQSWVVSHAAVDEDPALVCKVVRRWWLRVAEAGAMEGPAEKPDEKKTESNSWDDDEAGEDEDADRDSNQ